MSSHMHRLGVGPTPSIEQPLLAEKGLPSDNHQDSHHHDDEPHANGSQKAKESKSMVKKPDGNNNEVAVVIGVPQRSRHSASTAGHCTKACFCCHRYRYFILLLGWLCLTSISSNMIALNFTFICMSPPSSSTSLSSSSSSSSPSLSNYTAAVANRSERRPVGKDPFTTFRSDKLSKSHSSVENPHRDPRLAIPYSRREKDWLMWTVAVGSMLGAFPFSFLYARYGARWVLLAAGMLSAAATALIPWVAMERRFNVFLTLRLLQGIAYSADFAAMGVLCSRWASLKQNAFFISVLTCYSPLSTTITNPVAGMICESRYGWPMVYYVHAGVCFLLFSLWFIFYHDHPRASLFVSDVELEKINRKKSTAHINMEPYVPYRKILSNWLVWVVWINAFADLFSAMFLLMYLPSYLNYVLDYSVEKTGFLGALPTLLHMPLKFFFGYCSDKFRFVSERTKMLIFNTIAVAMPGVGYLVVGFVADPFSVVLIFTAILIFFSTSGCAFYKCGALCARQYAHFVIANIQFVKCLTLFMGPALMALFVRDETAREQWRIIFILLAVMLFAANLLFWRVATDEPADFTLITCDPAVEKKKKEEEKAKEIDGMGEDMKEKMKDVRRGSLAVGMSRLQKRLSTISIEAFELMGKGGC